MKKIHFPDIPAGLLVPALVLMALAMITLSSCGGYDTPSETQGMMQTTSEKETEKGEEKITEPDNKTTDDSSNMCKHKFGEWKCTKNPTCTHEGEEKRQCTKCGKVETREVDSLGHVPGNEATCTEPQICTVCKKVLEKGKDHTPGKEATCMEEQVCTVCNTVLEEVKDHTPGKEATCTEAQVCTVCHAILQEANGHDPGEEATCTTNQTCTVCGCTMVSAKGHKWESATCTSPKCCSVCGITDGEKMGHRMGTDLCCTRCGVDMSVDMISCVGNPISTSEHSDGFAWYFKNYSYTVLAADFAFHWQGRNLTGKTIKYIKITLDLYNAVDDKVYSFTSKKTGPISDGDTISFNFSDTIGNYYSTDLSNVEKVVLSKIQIDYIDGTTETGWYVVEGTKYLTKKEYSKS